MRALGSLLIVVAGCSPVSRPPSVIANRYKPEPWHLLALPGPDGEPADRTLVANIPPQDPCRHNYVEPLTGFVARITR